MAAAVDMVEVEEIHSKEDGVEDAPTMNGELSLNRKSEEEEENEENICNLDTDGEDEMCEPDEDVSSPQEIRNSDEEHSDASGSLHEDADSNSMDNPIDDDGSDEIHHIDNSDDEVSEVVDKSPSPSGEIHNLLERDQMLSDCVEVDDNDSEVVNGKKASESDDAAAILNDPGDGDVMIVDNDNDIPKENGDAHIEISDGEAPKSMDADVINLDSPVKRKKRETPSEPTRRSSRNVKKRKRYAESDSDDYAENTKVIDDSEGSDIEEIMPEDPLAVVDPLSNEKPLKRQRQLNSTIVVKDTKRLVEIAAKSSPTSSSKKEPTLVIIDTNSILSGRGPVPVTQKPPIIPASFSTLPMALPAQGMYPPNMRATITPIPINSSASSSPKNTSSPAQIAPPLLPTLTDDMFVVEAPSFIVPYVYEKPPLKDLKEFVKDVKKQIEDDKKKEDEERKKKDDEEIEEKSDTSADRDKDLDKQNESLDDDVEITDFRRLNSYFDSPLGKFFMDIGTSLVQEYVQSDLLRQQKKKREREGGKNSVTNKTIQTLIKDLEFSKENNISFRMETKKCEFCTFKTESALAMAYHLETPHMKNFVYRCNFCSYEIRSPHDILLHMESVHGVRGRLERAPAFHQCPNCPFEDNQKGKLSRHLVSCMRKFKPTKNLEPPLDWEPPAKIPRLPRMKQPGLNASTAIYQAVGKNPYQFINKMPSVPPASLIHRGRGRPTLGTSPKQPPMLRSPSMIYKQAMSGGSVLMPASYQFSGNQLYQVVGAPELGGRIGPVGPMALVPNMPTASGAMIQNASNKNKSLHQPSISITPLPRTASSSSGAAGKPGDGSSKNSFVICEICDGYIKDLEQLRNHMQWIHKVKIHPKMIYNRPPLNCQKCQFRFFTDQGLERHLLGSHGLVTSSMQEAANKGKDAGRCPVCGRVYQWKLLNHVARDHNMTLKPAHLSYKCTVCTATFGMYKQFESHVYSAHSVVAKRVVDKKSTSSPIKSDNALLKPLKINDEITIIPQPAKMSSNGAGTSKEGSPSGSASTSKSK